MSQITTHSKLLKTIENLFKTIIFFLYHLLISRLILLIMTSILSQLKLNL
jgi:hypothetical protein